MFVVVRMQIMQPCRRTTSKPFQALQGYATCMRY